MADDNRSIFEKLTKFRDPPNFTVEEYRAASFPEKTRMTTTAYCAMGWGMPLAVPMLYGVKMLFYVWIWCLCCGESIFDLPYWISNRDYFIKGLIWGMSFEGMGLGCSSGTFRYSFFADRSPAFLTKLFGGTKRTFLDVLGYALIQGLFWRVLLSSQPLTGYLLAPPLLLVGLMGFRDKLMWLCFRSEHYWVMASALALAGEASGGSASTAAAAAGIAACKWTALGIWFFAGCSKFYPHFSYVVTIMTANHPLMPAWFRRAMYVDYPRDLRPSTLAAMMAHSAVFFEIAAPLYLCFGPLGLLHDALVVAIILFHIHIVLNFPSAVPLEWQFLLFYHTYYLFSVHENVSLFQVFDVPLLAAWSLTWSWFLPIVGALVPSMISFLVAFRYYAGNWNLTLLVARDYQTWLKMKQVPSMYDIDSAAGLHAAGCSEAVQANLSNLGTTFALQHLPFRALASVLAKYRTREQMDQCHVMLGEAIPSIASGWNFGDGHLAGPAAIKYVAEKAKLDPGDLMLISMESAPIYTMTHRYEVFDFCDGLIGRGSYSAKDLLSVGVWDESVEVHDTQVKKKR